MSDKSKNILLGVLIVGLVSMTVAYAALSTSLTIGGTATVANAKWDIHFASVAVDTSASATTIPSTDYSLGTLDTALDQENTPATIGTALSGLSATLKKPGDKLTVNFNIVNAGTIDAKKATTNGFNMTITNHDDNTKTASGTTNNQAVTLDTVDYTINCSDPAILTKQGGATSTSACTLTLEYKSLDTGSTITGAQQSTTAGTDQTATVAGGTYDITAAWNYVQN